MKNNSNRKNNKPTETQTPVSLREQIKRKAYQIWIASGGGHGRDVEHWLQAETEIVRRNKQSADYSPSPLASGAATGRGPG